MIKYSRNDKDNKEDAFLCIMDDVKKYLNELDIVLKIECRTNKH